jgi:hypothetical protein
MLAPTRLVQPPRISRAGPQGRVSAIPRGTKGSWNLALPPPSPLRCAGGGWGGGKSSPRSGKGALVHPKEKDTSRDSAQRRGPLPRFLEGGWAVTLHGSERETRLWRKGRLAPGKEECALGRGLPDLRWE